MTARKEHRRVAAEYAARDFAEHGLVVEQGEGPVRMFLCRRPGTGMYHYRVVFGPRFVVVTGDIGERVLCVSDRDSLAWLLGARDSIDYVCGKMTERNEEFLEEETEEWLKEFGDEVAAKVRERWEDEQNEGIDPGLAWYRACYFSGIDDPPTCTDHSFRSLYIAQALRSFCLLYEAEITCTHTAAAGGAQ